MAVTSWIRRQFQDNVSVTDTIPAGVSSGATSWTTTNGTSFPDGSVGSFIVTLDQGLATEEKVLVASRSGATFTVAASGRGYGTGGASAQTHAANCTILHTIDAQDLDEANQVAVQTLGTVAAAGDLLIGSAAHTLARLAKGATNATLQAGSSTLSWVGFGVGQSQNVGTANSDGSQTTYARSDHAHNLPVATVEALFTADKQILSGTGSGTGELIDLLTALEEYFASNGQVIVGTGAGTGELFNPFPVSTTTAGAGTTTSSAFTDLTGTTVGPAVTVTTGTTALVVLTCQGSNATQNAGWEMGFAVSGASTIAATTSAMLNGTSFSAGFGTFYSCTLPVTGLTAGSNIFTAKYAAPAGTGTATISNRTITVFPLP